VWVNWHRGRCAGAVLLPLPENWLLRPKRGQGRDLALRWAGGRVLCLSLRRTAVSSYPRTEYWRHSLCWTGERATSARRRRERDSVPTLGERVGMFDLPEENCSQIHLQVAIRAALMSFSWRAGALGRPDECTRGALLASHGGCGCWSPGGW
jgi:hypothetical protein